MSDSNLQETVEGVGRENIIYTSRFSGEEDQTRAETWRVLARDFLAKRIPSAGVVVDLGAGDGNFIRNITARKRIAVDLSEHVKELEGDGIEVHVAPATQFAGLLSEPADLIFMSNFLEHLPTKQILLDVLDECRRALKPGGGVMILQPNIRYTGVSYWDYVDHHIALTEHSLVEALDISGFSVTELIPRFLPYTAKSRLGSFARANTAKLVEIYLKMPFLWRIFGQQTFVQAKVKLEGERS